MSAFKYASIVFVISDDLVLILLLCYHYNNYNYYNYVYFQLLHPDEDKRVQTVDQLQQLRFFEELSFDDVRERNITPSFIPPVSCIIMPRGIRYVFVCLKLQLLSNQ